MNPGESMLLPALLFHKPGFFLYSVTQMLMRCPLKPAHAHDGLVLLHIAVDALVQAPGEVGGGVEHTDVGVQRP